MNADQPPPSAGLRLARLLLAAACLVLPRASRPAFREAWEGELWHRALRLAPNDRSTLRAHLDLLRRASGAFSHALWVASRDFRREPMIQDLRYALRQLAGHRTFTAAALLTLALGIGANTLVFSLVDGVLLHPFPYPDIDRLVTLGISFPKLGGEERFIEAFSEPELADIEARATALEKVLAFDLGNRDLSGPGIEAPERLFTAFVWGDPFATLGMQPALGRGFTAEEITRGEAVAVLSHRAFQRHLRGDASRVGASITVNGEPRTLVGVMPPGLNLLDTDLWLPMWAARGVLPRGQRQFTALARLKGEAALERANVELKTIARAAEAEHGTAHPEYAGFSVAATPFLGVWASFVGPAGYVLLGAVGLVLLLACTNLASLLLARSSSRRAEMALRGALGAGQLRLFRQVLAESALLAAAGGLLGVLFAGWGLSLLRELPAVASLPIGGTIAVNGRVLAFALAASLLAGLSFGVLPAWSATRITLHSVLAAARSPSSAGTSRLRRALVVAEVALALVLMSGAGLLSLSLARLARIDPGIATENVLTMRLTLPRERYQGEQVVRFFDELRQKVEVLPGVQSAAVAAQFPPLMRLEERFAIEGDEVVSEEQLPNAGFTFASPELFATLGMRFEAGRPFGILDGAGAPAAVIVNRALAAKYFAGREALGQRLKISSPEAPWATVVGVVSDAHNRGLDQPPRPEIFAPVAQSAGLNNQLFLLAKTDTAAATFLPAVRRAVRELDADQPVYAVQTLEDAFAGTLAQRRIAAGALAVFGLIALALAAVGIYGLISYSVAERRQEIGIRLALGAERRRVVAMVCRQVALLLGTGLALGLVGALGFSRALAALLYEVRPADPLTLLTMAGLLGLTGALAGYLPARRAARLDPLLALKAE